MLDPLLLWVTRSAPFNARTRSHLAALGHRAVTVPALHIRPTSAPILTAPPTAIVFTSAHGVRYHAPQQDWRSLPVFAVGAHSAALARQRGYADIRCADGDLSDLRALLAEAIGRDDHVVHFGAREPAGDLVGDLSAAGISAELAMVYESVQAAREQLRSVTSTLPFINGIVLHSPKGAQVAADLARRTGWYGIAFCLSPACAAPFAGVPGVSIETARAPTEARLLDLLRAGRRAPLPEWTRGFRLDGEDTAARPALRLVVSNDREVGAGQLAAGSGDGPDDLPPTAA